MKLSVLCFYLFGIAGGAMASNLTIPYEAKIEASTFGELRQLSPESRKGLKTYLTYGDYLVKSELTCTDALNALSQFLNSNLDKSKVMNEYILECGKPRPGELSLLVEYLCEAKTPEDTSALLKYLWSHEDQEVIGHRFTFRPLNGVFSHMVLESVTLHSIHPLKYDSLQASVTHRLFSSFGEFHQFTDDAYLAFQKETGIFLKFIEPWFSPAHTDYLKKNIFPEANGVLAKFDETTYLLEDNVTVDSLLGHTVGRDCRNSPNKKCL